MENSYITGFLDELLKAYLDDLSSFFLVAKVIAGIGLLISTYFTFFKLMGGDDDAIRKYLAKFILIFLGIVYYNTFLQVVNYPLDLITNVAREMTEKDFENISKLQNIKTNKIIGTNYETDPVLEAKIEKNFGTPPETDDSESPSFASTVANIGNFITDAITKMITAFLTMIAELCLIILNIIRSFFLIVLSIFGIFVIALSSFETLEGSFTAWLTKYINVYLWLALGFILQSMIVKIELLSLEKSIAQGGNFETMGSSQYNVVIQICTIIGFFAIPTLSGWLISAATNGASSKMGQTLGQGKQAIGKAIGNAAKASAGIPPVSV